MGKELEWFWDNREWIKSRLDDLRSWLAKKNNQDKNAKKGILILGPQGSGKSTLGRFLTGEYDYVLDIPDAYSESPGIEVFSIEKDLLDAVVAPGQIHRMDTWDPLLTKMRQGDFSGIILISAYGYDSIGEYDYRNDPSWDGDKSRFVDEYTARRREIEDQIWEKISTELTKCTHRIWLLHIVNKQDLWWKSRQAVEQHYRKICDNSIKEIQISLGKNNFRSELVYMSLVIGNFSTSNQDVLANNVAGYEHSIQVKSLRKLLEVLDALREWEANK